MKRQINGKTYSKTIGIKKGSLLAAGKDGDIEEYKADAADAGKVLTVGEDGGVAPAEGGGGGGSIIVTGTYVPEEDYEEYRIPISVEQMKSYFESGTPVYAKFNLNQGQILVSHLSYLQDFISDNVHRYVVQINVFAYGSPAIVSLYAVDGDTSFVGTT